MGTDMLKRIFKTVLAPALCLFANAASAQIQCSDYSSGTALLNATQTNYGECTVTPSAVKYTVFDISLCTARPEVGAVSSCTSIFNSTSGREVVVSDATTIALNPNVDLQTADYSYATLTLDKRYGIKMLLDMGFDVGGWYDSANSQVSSVGQYCWTNGADIDLSGLTAGNIRCGSDYQSAAAQAEVSHEEITYLDDSPNMTASYDGIPAIDGAFDVRLLAPNGQLATVNPTTVGPNDTEKLFIIIPLPSVQRVDETTTNIDVGFQVTDLANLHVIQCPDPNNPVSMCFQNGVINGIGFYARVR